MPFLKVSLRARTRYRYTDGHQELAHVQGLLRQHLHSHPDVSAKRLVTFIDQDMARYIHSVCNETGGVYDGWTAVAEGMEYVPPRTLKAFDEDMSEVYQPVTKWTGVCV